MRPKNAWWRIGAKGRVCFPCLMGRLGWALVQCALAAGPRPGRALACGAAATAVSAMATSAPAALHAMATAQLPGLGNISRLPGIRRSWEPVLAADEGAMALPSIF